MKVSYVELSLHGRQRFTEAFPLAMLFDLPQAAVFREAIQVMSFEEELQKWLRDGVFPWKLIATRMYMHIKAKGVMKQSGIVASIDLDQETTRVVDRREDATFIEELTFWSPAANELRFNMHVEAVTPDRDVRAHSYSEYAVRYEDGKFMYGIFRPNDNVLELVDDATVAIFTQNGEQFGTQKAITQKAIKDAHVRNEMFVALRRFNWLMQSLQSVNYSAVAGERIGRQVARSTHQPRDSYKIIIRPNRKTYKSTKEQFKEEFRQAHAVRGHLRREHTRKLPSGRTVPVRSMKVSPHIRGKGGAAQLKEYEFRTAAVLVPDAIKP